MEAVPSVVAFVARVSSMSEAFATMKVVDSHTEGEPTRVIVDGGPKLGTGPLPDRLARFRDQFDEYRQFAVNEPRGWDAVVGALLCEPVDPTCVAGVIFFNNVGYLNMCGHGTIGVIVTLAYLGKISPGVHRLETPVGIVACELHDDHRVTIENVPSYLYRSGVEIELPNGETITGNVAWGGNWFFLTDAAPCPLIPEFIPQLTSYCLTIREQLEKQSITGHDGGVIDHIEVNGKPHTNDAHSRNFVLCPGGAYDRSPCGTGTSAKLATAAAAGLIEPGETWIQESILSSRFEASYESTESPLEGCQAISPRVTGRAFITADATLIRQSGDPFRGCQFEANAAKAQP